MKSMVLVQALFSAFLFVAVHAEQKQYTMSLNGPKDGVPIEGVILQGQDKSKMNLLQSTLTTWQSDIDSKLKALQETVSNISDKLDKADAFSSDSRKQLAMLMVKMDQVLTAENYNGYIGCYTDGSNRHLKDKGTDMGDSISLAKCKKHCLGYKFLGLQYASWCFCGNTLQSETNQKVPDTQCNMTCKGESNRMCGGHYRNSIYTV